MKYCQKCGVQIHEDAEICPKCGCRAGNAKNPEHDKPATGVGVLCGLFLGIIGLIIGIILYPSETVARKTFIKAWAWTFGISVAVGIVVSIIISIFYSAFFAAYFGMFY